MAGFASQSNFESVSASRLTQNKPWSVTKWCMTIQRLKRLPADGILRILAQHQAYRDGRPGGRRAKFDYCDLRGQQFAGLDLQDADFTGARLDGANFERANLTSAAFFGADLRRVNFREASLRRGDLRGSLVHGADLTSADLSEADLREGVVARQSGDGHLTQITHASLPTSTGEALFRGATLSGAKMGGVIAIAADFSFATMRHVRLVRAHLKQAIMVGTDLSGADLSGADFEGADLRNAIIVGAKTDMMRTRGANMTGVLREPPPLDIIEAARIATLLDNHVLWRTTMGKQGSPATFDGLDLRGAHNLARKPLTGLRARNAVLFGLDMTGCELQGATMNEADLRQVNLSSADMRGCSLRGTQLQMSKLDGADLGPLVLPDGRQVVADLSGADLTATSLRGANLANANLSGAIVYGAQLTGANLTGANLTDVSMVEAVGYVKAA